MTIDEDIQEHLSEPESVDAAVAVARAELLWERYAATGLLCSTRCSTRSRPSSNPCRKMYRSGGCGPRPGQHVARTPIDQRQRRPAGRVAAPCRRSDGTRVLQPVRLLNFLGVRGWQDYVRTGALGALDEAVSQWRRPLRTSQTGTGPAASS